MNDLPLGLVNGPGSSALKEQPEKFARLDFALPGYNKVCTVSLSDLDLLQIAFVNLNRVVYFTAFPVAIVGYFSAKHQGNVATAGMQILAKRPEDMMASYLRPWLKLTPSWPSLCPSY